MAEPTEQDKFSNPRVVDVDGIQVDVTGDLTDEQVRQYVEMALGEEDAK
jgi:hypothetical protein